MIMTEWVRFHSKSIITTMSDQEVREKVLPEMEQKIEQLMEKFHPPENTIAALEAAFPSMSVARKE